MPRTILHCDMDAFYASIEQRDHPPWRGKPVIVGGIGKRSVVSTASYEARKFGIRSAMPGSEARRLCPHGIFAKPRMEVYAAESRKIQAVFERFTPQVEPLSLDEAFLDVTASRDLWGSGEAIARRIKEGVREETALTISIGIAASKYVAKVASDLRKPDGLVVVPAGGEEAFLGGLPVSRLWGAGKVAQARFEKLGLRTIGDVQRLSRADLAAVFGPAMGEHFHALSHGIDPREVIPGHDARSIGHETTFAEDVTNDEECHRILLGLAEAVGRRLRRDGLRAATVRLKLRYPPFTTLSRQVRLPAPSHDDVEIFRAAKALLDAARPPGKPVRLLGVSVAGLAAGPVERQADLFAQPGREAKKEQLLRALDAIRDRFGEEAIRRGR